MFISILETDTLFANVTFLFNNCYAKNDVMLLSYYSYLDNSNSAHKSSGIWFPPINTWCIFPVYIEGKILTYFFSVFWWEKLAYFFSVFWRENISLFLQCILKTYISQIPSINTAGGIWVLPLNTWGLYLSFLPINSRGCGTFAVLSNKNFPRTFGKDL